MGVALASSTAIGIVAGGIVGPLVGLLVPAPTKRAETLGSGALDAADLDAAPR